MIEKNIWQSSKQKLENNENHYHKYAICSDVGFHFGNIRLPLSRCGACCSGRVVRNLWGGGSPFGPMLAFLGAQLV